MKRLVFALVLALGLGVFAAVPASAVSEAREAEITYRCIKIVLDGLEICPRDAKGNEVEPFILGGTTYLPVRAVAEALGLEVRWRGSDSTVLLSDPMTGSAFRDALPLPPELPATAESAHGHSGVESVTLSYRDIRVLVDGVSAVLRDAAGNEVEPFTLGGTTYLPVRAVAELLGRAVSWDADTSTVRLSTRLVSRRASESVHDGGSGGALADTYEYNSYGQMTRSVEDTGMNRTETRLSYDGAGRLVSSESLAYSTLLRPETLSARRTTSYSYDGASGLCVSAETKTEGDSVSCTCKTEYEYDEQGRLTAVNGSLTRVDGGEVYAEERRCVRSYDGQGRLAAEKLTVSSSSSPSGGALGTFTFRYSYDGDWRPTSALLDGTDEPLRLYDTAGSLTAAVGSQEYSYDGAGRRARLVVYEGGSENVESTTGYSYDENGLLSEMRRVDGGPAALETVVAYFHDENGVLIRYEYGGSSFGQGTVVTSYEYVLAGE